MKNIQTDNPITITQVSDSSVVYTELLTQANGDVYILTVIWSELHSYGFLG